MSCSPVHHRIILLKYVMLITVNKNFTILITNYTWYHRYNYYKEIIQIAGGSSLWLHQMPDSKAGRRKVKCSDVTWASSTQSSHRHQLVVQVLLTLSLMIQLSFKQSESTLSCNGSSDSNWYGWMSVAM